MYIIQVCERLERLNTRGKCLTLKLMLRAENAPEQTAKFLGKNQLCFLKDRFLCETGRNVNPQFTKKLKNITYYYYVSCSLLIKYFRDFKIIQY